MKELYAGHESAILMLDDVLGRSDEDVEVEDILGEAVIMPAVNALIGKTIELGDNDRKAGSLPKAIKAAASRLKIELPDGWKASVAIQLVSEWAERNTKLDNAVLARAEALFNAINGRFK